MTDIQKTLFSMADKNFKSFNSKLIPTVNPDKIIGVRTPELRRYAKNLAAQPQSAKFLTVLPHDYYEENNLHAYIIEVIHDFDGALDETERFLPYIDNWATCDTFLPKSFRKNTAALMPHIKKWLKSSHTYTVRYAIKLLMSLFLEENFSSEINELVSKVHSDEYYINMMIAWHFATALAKQYDATIGYITNRRLDTWTHNKAIQKAIESHRISHETKDILRGLKIIK
ncbi:MAG: DNA alkylation repair protein [Firmicutes bacterium]|nr:DNA alkylation repair protein [Bacillota bacterium]